MTVGVFVCRAAYDGYVDSIDKDKIGEKIAEMINKGFCEKTIVNKKILEKIGL